MDSRAITCLDVQLMTYDNRTKHVVVASLNKDSWMSFTGSATISSDV